MRTGEPELYNDIPDELLAESAVDEEHLSLLRELALRSVLMVPIRGATRTLGAMTLVASESARRFTEEDVRFAEQLAERTLRQREFDQVGGWGLEIVEELASCWGVHEGTTHVRFELERPGPRLGEPERPDV